MSFLGDLFGGGKKMNPSAEANKYLNQIPQIGHNAYDDYIKQGKESGTNVHGQYEDLLNDPQGFINKIMGGYQPSEGYQFQKGQLEKQLGNTAAAGGIAGTPQDQMNQGQAIQGLLSQDQQQWLSNILGVYGQGLQGEQGEATQGYNASEGLGGLLGNNLASQGGLAFQGAQQNNADRTSMINSWIKALGQGGAMATNPTGSLFGHKLWG